MNSSTNRKETVTLEMSKHDAMSVWMQLKDPTLVDRLTGEQGNAYSPDMLRAIDGMLDKQDKIFAQNLMDIYQEIRPQINEVYARMYGVNMDNNLFYSPVRVAGELGPADMASQKTITNTTFLEEQKFRAGVSKSATKLRTGSQAALAVDGAVAVMLRHMKDMSHFVAMAEKVRHLSGVYSDPHLREAIEKKHSKSTVLYIDGFLEDASRGHARGGSLRGDGV